MHNNPSLADSESDLLIKCADGDVKTTRALLMGASTPFNTMLTHFKEASSDIITLQEDSANDVQAFVNFIQFKEIPSDLVDLCNMTLFLDKYGVNEAQSDVIMKKLRDHCTFIIDAITICSILCTPTYGEFHKMTGKMLIEYMHDHRMAKCDNCDRYALHNCKACHNVAKYKEYYYPCNEGHELNNNTTRECPMCKKTMVIAKRVDLLADVDPEVIGMIIMQYHCST